MEIDDETHSLDHVKDHEAMITRKLEKISQGLKVIGRFACQIDDTLFCLKHCRRSLEGKVNSVSKVRNQEAIDAIAMNDKSGDALAAMMESLHHFDEQKKSTVRSILATLESICSNAAFESTLSDLGAISSNMEAFAASATSISKHRLLVEGMRDLNETFENISSIAQQATGGSTARSNRPSTQPADISGYFLPGQSATRRSSSGRAVKNFYKDGSSDESDFDIDKGKGKGKGTRREEEEDQDYWHESASASGNHPSKKTTSVDNRLSNVVQSEDAEFEDDHDYFSKQVAGNKKRTSSAKGKIKYTLSQDEPDAVVVLDDRSPVFAPVKPRAHTVSAWALMRPVHNEAGRKALAPPTVPEITPNGGSLRGPSPLEENVINLEDSNEVRSVLARDSPKSLLPPQVPPIVAPDQQQSQRYENRRSEETVSEGRESGEEEEEVEVEEREYAQEQATEEDMFETATQPQVGQDFGEGQDEDTQDTEEMMRGNHCRGAETRAHQDQYFHDPADEEEEEDGDIREPCQYLPSSSQPDSQSQGHGSNPFLTPQCSDDDNDELDSAEGVVYQTKNAAAGAATRLPAGASPVPSSGLPDYAAMSTGVGSPGGPRRRGEKNTPHVLPSKTEPRPANSSRTHIQESKLSSPSTTSHTDRHDHYSHPQDRSHGSGSGSGGVVNAKPAVHSEPRSPGAQPVEVELPRHQHAQHAPRQEENMPSEQRASSTGTGTQSPTESDDEDQRWVNTNEKGHMGTFAAFGGADAFARFVDPMGKRSREEGEEREPRKTSKRDSPGGRCDELPTAELAAPARSHRSKHHQGHTEGHSTRHQHAEATEVVDLT